MAEKVLVVKAEWDSEAAVWVAESDDIPGLVAEAATIEELERELHLLVPELLRLNGVSGDTLDSVPIELIARKTEKVKLAH